MGEVLKPQQRNTNYGGIPTSRIVRRSAEGSCLDIEQNQISGIWTSWITPQLERYTICTGMLSFFFVSIYWGISGMTFICLGTHGMAYQIVQKNYDKYTPYWTPLLKVLIFSLSVGMVPKHVRYHFSSVLLGSVRNANNYIHLKLRQKGQRKSNFWVILFTRRIASSFHLKYNDRAVGLMIFDTKAS